jgi:hypothetical protein
MIAEGIKTVLRDIEVPESKVAIVATKVQQVFRDVAIPASRSMYKSDKNVFKKKLKSFGAVESPVQRWKPTGRYVSKDWIKDREDKRNSKKTY